MGERAFIAVVDDDCAILEALPVFLTSKGYEAAAFPSAKAYLDSERRADCLILDVAMPAMSGPELQEELVRRGVQTPIIFITGDAQSPAARPLLEAGALACLSKPFSGAKLMETIERALGPHSASRTPRGADPLTATQAGGRSDAGRGTVFIVDDDVSVRESLAGLMEVYGWQAKAFPTAGAFLAAAPPSDPCCVVLDLDLPDLGGLDVQALIAHERTEMPIIFLTGYGDIPSSVQAMKAGAVEFLTKPFDEAALLAVIGDALERSKTAQAAAAERRRLVARYQTLSRREKEVMALVIRGLLNKQVAWELGISEITVKAHRGRVMDKMQVRTLADLVKCGQRLSLDPSW